MEKVFIVGAVRTAIGTFGGALRDVKVVELGRAVIEEALRRAGVEKDQVDEVLMGTTLQGGTRQNPGRQASVQAGIPVTVPALTVNKACGSGLKTVSSATQAIQLGDADIIVAGGMESMSGAPYMQPSLRWGKRMGDDKVYDSLLLDGLMCALEDIHMGVTAENIAIKYGISREEQDQFALESQHKTERALDAGRFKEEIVPVQVPQKKGDPLEFEIDEHLRKGATLEKLGKLPPAFKKDGTVTAGNASGINDGAAAVVLASESAVKKWGLKPLYRITGYASAGVEPSIMGTGPIAAVKKLQKRFDINLKDIDLFEINEAFAAQALSVIKELNLDPEITNVNGGAIALGHPVGASGCRILVTLIYEMMKREASTGLASLCIGGGQGIAVTVEKV